ncbi:uncharacterized protein [Penaeus vannamei]|uniref:uncharacterized protein isoform X2 n=1 Tax=Penaeus vannamei TaxID=6689 RepID=UPI00387F3EFF
MPRRCVAIHCSHTCNQLFEWPKDSDRARKWTRFVHAKRSNFQPVPTSVLCLKHFEPDCFANRMAYDQGFAKRLMLKPDAVPTLQLPPPGPGQGGKEVQLTPRGAASKRARKRLLDEAAVANSLEQPPVTAAETCATATFSSTVAEGVECTSDCVNGETVSQLTSPGAGEQQQVSKAHKITGCHERGLEIEDPESDEDTDMPSNTIWVKEGLCSEDVSSKLCMEQPKLMQDFDVKAENDEEFEEIECKFEVKDEPIEYYDSEHSIGVKEESDGRDDASISCQLENGHRASQRRSFNLASDDSDSNSDLDKDDDGFDSDDENKDDGVTPGTSTTKAKGTTVAGHTQLVMDVEEVVCAWVLYRRLQRRRRRQRRYWVHPILKDRLTYGMFFTLYPKLREYEPKFFNYMRMSIKSFDDLLEQIQDDISSTSTMMRDCISPEEKLVITLRYLATGCSIADLHYGYRLGKSTISSILQQVCVVIWERLKTMCLPVMTKEKWEEVAQGFEKHANFPNCIGAIDGKHIRLIKPNYKNFSTVLLAVCDTNYSFIYLDIVSYGKSSDVSVFHNSSLYKKLVERTLDIPKARPISGTSTCLPYVIVSDEAFGIMDHIMRPYCGRYLTHTKKIFNYRLSRARQYIECTFGILAKKWRIFHRPLNVNITFAENIIKACCILHNYVRARDGYRYEDTLFEAPLEGLQEGNAPRGGMSAVSARDKYAEYFITDGRVEWQDNMI